MPKQFAQRAINLPKIPFHFPSKDSLKKIIWWSVKLVIALALIAFAVYYFGAQKPAEQARAVADLRAQRAVQNAELARDFSYPTCAGASRLTTLDRDNPAATITVRRDCWSGWIKVRGYCYFSHPDAGNAYVWYKSDYDADLPSTKQIDNTYTKDYKACYFKFRAEENSVRMTIEAR